MRALSRLRRARRASLLVLDLAVRGLGTWGVLATSNRLYSSVLSGMMSPSSSTAPRSLADMVRSSAGGADAGAGGATRSLMTLRPALLRALKLVMSKAEVPPHVPGGSDPAPVVASKSCRVPSVRPPGRSRAASLGDSMGCDITTSTNVQLAPQATPTARVLESWAGGDAAPDEALENRTGGGGGGV